MVLTLRHVSSLCSSLLTPVGGWGRWSCGEQGWYPEMLPTLSCSVTFHSCISHAEKLHHWAWPQTQQCNTTVSSRSASATSHTLQQTFLSCHESIFLRTFRTSCPCWFFFFSPQFHDNRAHFTCWRTLRRCGWKLCNELEVRMFCSWADQSPSGTAWSM